MIGNYTTFIFVRHAESKKNVRNVTGGYGERLTEKGIEQAKKLSNILLSKNAIISSTPNIICSEIIQARQTAEIISDKLNRPLIITNSLAPAGMGVISGLSSDEIISHYPEVLPQLEAWHKKEIEAIDLNIIGMESPIDFWDRVFSYICSLCNNQMNLVIATRSILVLVTNLVNGATPFQGGGYRHYTINHCDTISFRCNVGLKNIDIIPDLTTIKGD